MRPPAEDGHPPLAASQAMHMSEVPGPVAGRVTWARSAAGVACCAGQTTHCRASKGSASQPPVREDRAPGRTPTRGLPKDPSRCGHRAAREAAAFPRPLRGATPPRGEATCKTGPAPARAVLPYPGLPQPLTPCHLRPGHLLQSPSPIQTGLSTHVPGRLPLPACRSPLQVPPSRHPAPASGPTSLDVPGERPQGFPGSALPRAPATTRPLQQGALRGPQSRKRTLPCRDPVSHRSLRRAPGWARTPPGTLGPPTCLGCRAQLSAHGTAWETPQGRREAARDLQHARARGLSPEASAGRRSPCFLGPAGGRLPQTHPSGC
ncbi:skin secretory protein xP2-like [Phacochoerus africanus]|uniref:skin secretory protein xP2-like n=1 Tax=Phacochoerus africanus TaxID=41426 RepID=UPI001FD8ED30|nr:skin secretory protein xP2-like [Phacochoerus africanus]